MFKFTTGDRVRVNGKLHKVLARWSSGVGPWYEVRQVKGRGLAGYSLAKPEHKLQKE